MSRPTNAERETPRTDAWRIRLSDALSGRGRRAELARWLSGGDPTKFESRRVQIATVLSQGVVPDAEFVLAVEEWLRGTLKAAQTKGTAKKTRKPAKTPNPNGTTGKT